jgi:hypothetical protein
MCKVLPRFNFCMLQLVQSVAGVIYYILVIALLVPCRCIHSWHDCCMGCLYSAFYNTFRQCRTCIFFTYLHSVFDTDRDLSSLYNGCVTMSTQCHQSSTYTKPTLDLRSHVSFTVCVGPCTCWTSHAAGVYMRAQLFLGGAVNPVLCTSNTGLEGCISHVHYGVGTWQQAGKQGREMHCAAPCRCAPTYRVWKRMVPSGSPHPGASL